MVLGILFALLVSVTGSALAATLHVAVRDGGYIPRVLSAAPCDTVIFTNVGHHAHTVNCDAAGAPDIGKIEPGCSGQWVVPQNACPGTRYYYHCSLHGKPGNGVSLGTGMAGAVVIGKVAGPAVESETLIGPTGGAFLPTSDVLDKDVADLSAGFYDTSDNSTVPVRALGGIGYGTEIGGVYEANSFSNVWGANFKYVYPLFNNQPFSLGGLYLSADENQATGWQGYLVHTHTFTRPESAQTIRATLGVNWTRVSLNRDSDCESDTQSEFRLFGGADLTLAAGLTLGAEIQSASGDLGDAMPLSSIYARYRINDRLRAEAGWTNGSPFGVLADDDHRVFVGLSYAFGHETYRMMGDTGSYGY